MMLHRLFPLLALLLLLLPLLAALPVQAQSGTSYIAFSSDRDAIEGEIYLMRSDGTDVVRLTHNTYIDYDPDIAPDASLVVYVSEQDGDPDLWAAATDGSSTWRMTFTEYEDSQPDIAPDSSQVVFMSTRDTQVAGHRQIYQCTLPNCSAVTRLTYTVSDDVTPSWSPDGQRIAFTSDRDGDDEIYSMNTSGGDVRRLTESAGKDIYCDWYENTIVFQSDRAGNWDIYLMNDDGTNVTQLTDHAASDTNPSFSPDGTRIVFTSTRDGNHELYTMARDGTNLQRLTENSAIDSHPSWSHTIGLMVPTLTPPAPLTHTAEIEYYLHRSEQRGRVNTALMLFFAGTIPVLLAFLVIRIRQ